MGMRRRSCSCYDDWTESTLIRKDFRQDHGSDGFEETPYRKNKGKNWRGRKTRPCAKSKTGEMCDFSKYIVKGSKRRREGNGYVPRYVRVCSRCNKEDWSYHDWW